MKKKLPKKTPKKLPKKVRDNLSDAVAEFAYYGRKGDEDLSVDELAIVMADPEMRRQAVEQFRKELEDTFGSKS